MSVPRGTTPTFTLTLPQSFEGDLTTAKNVYATFQSGYKSVTKEGEDLEITTRSVSVFLSQEETLSFGVGEVEIQLNWTTATGKRFASDVTKYQITKQLLQRVVE